MGDIALPGTRRLRWLGRGLGLAALVTAAALSSGCTPDYDWREISGPGGEYRVHLPGRPAVMTRRIHLEGVEVEMTMQGAKVKGNAFTVAQVPLPPQPSALETESPPQESAPVTGSASPSSARPGEMSSERILTAMREQMLRNIGASPTTEAKAAAADLVDADGTKVGNVPLQAVIAQGTGRHAGTQLRGRFGLWRGHALQIVAVGPGMDEEQVEHFLDSLRLVRP